MKQKFLIAKNTDNEITIREYSELDKDEFSLLSETSFEPAPIGDALAKGQEALISHLRSNHLFPPRAYIERIAAAVAQLFQDPAENVDPIEILLEDKENLEPSQADMDDAEEAKENYKEDIEEESNDIDNLLSDETEIDTTKSIKVADADSLETDTSS